MKTIVTVITPDRLADVMRRLQEARTGRVTVTPETQSPLGAFSPGPGRTQRPLPVPAPGLRLEVAAEDSLVRQIVETLCLAGPLPSGGARKVLVIDAPRAN